MKSTLNPHAIDQLVHRRPFIVKVKKAKQSLHCPRETLRVPEGWGFHISRQKGHEGCQPYTPTALNPYKIFLVFIRWRMSRSQGRKDYGNAKFQRHHPATFRLVAQCVDRLRHRLAPRIVKTGFNPNAVHAEFVMENLAVGQVNVLIYLFSQISVNPPMLYAHISFI
jgi:hypothetical protein